MRFLPSIFSGNAVILKHDGGYSFPFEELLFFKYFLKGVQITYKFSVIYVMDELKLCEC